MMTAEEIKTRLEETFPGSQVEVRDLTGTSDHWQVTVVSEKFKGLTLIDQHKMVYAPFEGDIQGAIHAFSIKTMTPDQLKN